MPHLKLSSISTTPISTLNTLTMIGTWMEWWSATVPLCKEWLSFYWIVQIAKHIFIFYYVFTVGRDGLFNRYDTVPMPTQMVRPTPTYFSQLGNDGVERLPFNLKEVTSWNKPHQSNLRISCYRQQMSVQWVKTIRRFIRGVLQGIEEIPKLFTTQLRLCTVYIYRP